MATWKMMLIVRRRNATEWKNIGEYELPVLPGIGEHVVVSERANQPLSAYRVVGILHPAPNKGLIDVLAVYDGSHTDVQNRLVVQAKDFSGAEACDTAVGFLIAINLIAFSWTSKIFREQLGTAFIRSRLCGKTCGKASDGNCVCEGSCTKAEMDWVAGGGQFGEIEESRVN